MPVVTQMSNLELLSHMVGENIAYNLLHENQGSLYQLFCQSAMWTTGCVRTSRPAHGTKSACDSMSPASWSGADWRKA